MWKMPKRPVSQDFNSLFGAPINLKKTKEKIQNGKQKEKNKENVDVSSEKVNMTSLNWTPKWRQYDAIIQKKKKDKKLKMKNEIKNDVKQKVKDEPKEEPKEVMKSPPPKSKKVFTFDSISGIVNG